MLGFARRFRPVRLTEDWMAELRPEASDDTAAPSTTDESE
jgi:hypothetical protein